MKILFCNIGWMRDYRGITHDDTVEYRGLNSNRGHEGLEEYNFLQKNGFCFGYVSAACGFEEFIQIHIEKIDRLGLSEEMTHNVLVIWTSEDFNTQKHVKIVGWYKDAEVFRWCRDDGIAFYNIRALAENCTLLPLDFRTFEIERSAKEEEGVWFNQDNIWYADSPESEKVINSVKMYVSQYQSGRHNTIIKPEALLDKADDGLYSAADYLDKAEVLYEDGKDIEALLYCNSAIYMGYGAEDVYNLRGLILYDLYEYDEALKSYDRALKLHPDFPEVFYNKALVYEETKDFENALLNYDTFLKYCSQSLEAYLGKGQIFLQLGEPVKAEQCFNKAIEIEPYNAQVYTYNATALIELGEYKEALKSINKAVELNTYDENSENMKERILQILKTRKADDDFS